MSRATIQKATAILLGLLLVLSMISRQGGAQGLPTETLIVGAVADTFTESANPTTVYDDDPRLRADASPERVIYLRFAVTGVLGRTVERAELKLHVVGPSDDTGGTLHVVSDTGWDPGAVTHDTRPALDGPVLQTLGGRGRRRKFVTFDLSGSVPADGVYSFAISSTSGDSVSYVSTAAGQGVPPELHLTVSQRRCTRRLHPPASRWRHVSSTATW